jgi:hypothetical protein
MQAFSALAAALIGDHHGAGAAVALVAAFLGAGQARASRAANPEASASGFPP